MMMLHRWSHWTRMLWWSERACEQMAARLQRFRVRSQLRDTNKIELSAVGDVETSL